MGVFIYNVSLHSGKEAACQYEVRINRNLIARFEHWRGDGLATCLRKAADAVDAAGHENPYAGHARSQDNREG